MQNANEVINGRNMYVVYMFIMDNEILLELSKSISTPHRLQNVQYDINMKYR